jgi:hypothetical protein
MLPLPIVLLSCNPADDPPPVAAGPIRDTLVQDQIDHTREHTPEAPPEETPDYVLTQPVVPVSRDVAPPPPTNTAPAPPPPSVVSSVQSHPDAPSHAAWNSLLQRFVNGDGAVDYRGFARAENELNVYLETLAEATPDTDWSRAERLAYWINAYNAFTIKLILDHLPLSSIRDIEQPWATKWIELDGETYSLDDIEHRIIRPTFDEPRIHFALVCAAASCPPLANQAFTARNLNRLLEERAITFIRDETFNVTQEAVVRVSPIFDWYGEDFGDLRDYFNQYLRTDIPEGKEITFLEYDWSLNDRE